MATYLDRTVIGTLAYSLAWFASWDLPLYVMGALFPIGAGCWGLVDPGPPGFAEASNAFNQGD